MFNVWIGYDQREHVAYEVAVNSLVRHANPPVAIKPLDQKVLRDHGHYRRPHDELASTEFTYTRFLVPYLQKTGWCLFVDCDVLFRANVNELMKLADPKYAVRVVKHDYRPKNQKKMDGKSQTVYPRKLWSSLVLWNCDHPANAPLVDRIDWANEKPPAFLHRFQWLKDEEIGSIPEYWNWIPGHSSPAMDPRMVHFTEGGPWFTGYSDVEYADEWRGLFSELVG